MALGFLHCGGALAAASASAGKLAVRWGLMSSGPNSKARCAGWIDSSNSSFLAPALALLPPGPAWTASPGSMLRTVVDSLARDLSRVDAAASSLGRQLVPGAAGELLSEWESAAGLSGHEEAEDAAEAEEIRRQVVAAGGRLDGYRSLTARRAAAVASRLAETQPFSLSELELRAKRLVLYRRVVGATAQAWAFSGIEVARQQPFRAGARVGQPVCGAAWAFSYDVTLITDAPFQTDGGLLSRINARGRPLLDWIRRSWPPWCGLRLYVRRGGAYRYPEPVLSINNH